MSKTLIIIESKGKIPKFKKVLGSGHEVLATFGHCVDLPEKSLAIDIKKDFAPTWEIKADRKNILTAIRTAAKRADKVFLLTDEDREGEAIAWHIKREIEPHTKASIHRATTNEITAKGIKDALSKPGDIDDSKVDAYLARRLLDRLCGYKTSYLTKQATGGRSAGRVQSAILRIIVDREIEIQNFKPVEYWVLTAHFISSKGDSYTGVLTDKIKVPDAKTATDYYNKIIGGSPVVTSVESKDATINPYAPFVTSTMQQTASTVFGWSASKTMQVAQGLYEGGHITYMRTDSPFMADEAVQACRSHIQQHVGANYLHPTTRTFRAKKGAQEAHECCRVTDICHTPPVPGSQVTWVNLGISGDHARLYEMIWRRTVATQMSSGQDRRTKVVTTINGYEFISRGNVIVFDGFRRIWTFSKSKDAILPVLTQGEHVSLKALEKEQKFTQPPPRYSDASLSKRCEDAQIARPATFASFLKTLESRGYIRRVKKTFHATELGIKVIEFLVAANICFVDIQFTSEMEELLDQIQGQSADKVTVLRNFWERLKCDIENGKKIKQEQQVTKFKYPKCKGRLLSKHSKFGPFLSCENYSNKENKCPYTANIGDDGKPVEKVAKKKEYASFACTKCGSKMVKRNSKYGEFYGCEKYPTCKTTSDLDGNFKDPSKKKKKWTKK